jgi:serine protease Do
VNRVKQIINNLKKQKYIQKGFIGVSLLPVTKDIARQLRWNHTYGAVVENTLEGGPAQRAGLRRGDIIYGVNDKKVQNVNDLIDAIEKIGAGHVIKLLVWRSGRRMKFSFRIASRPAQPSL